jgi:hypothetical protein
MIDITILTSSKLEEDLQASKDDITVCIDALSSGIKSYSGGSVEDRLKSNINFIEVITKELTRRKYEKT